MPLAVRPAGIEDAAALAELHTAVAGHLTARYGRGPWSTKTSERGVLHAMRHSHVFVAHAGDELVATFRLTEKKPWAIDTRYFTPCAKALYLLAMAVTPSRQRQGLGRACLENALRLAKDSSAGFLRLDSYDSEAGAGGFYARCGWTEVARAVYRGTPLVYFELAI